MTTPTVFVAGGVSFNTIIDVDSLPNGQPQTLLSRGYRQAVGGTGAGKAANLAKLGLNTTLHATLGEDAYGEQVQAFLARAGVRLLYDIDPHGTERHVNLMAAEGGRTSVFMAYARTDPPVDFLRLEPEIAAADQVMINVINYCRGLLAVAKRYSKPIWCDVHDWDGQPGYMSDFVAGADYPLMSSDRLPDYRDVMQKLVSSGKQCVVTTHGRHGATALTAQGEWVEQPALAQYQRVDTNGAGDAFFSGLLLGHTRGCSIAQSMQLATVVAGLCVTSTELTHHALTPTLLAQEYEKHYGHRLN
jgi:acarbose 7IV-phosphotransferase